MSRIELEDSQINILLNLAYLNGKREFTINSPLLKTELFRIELNRREWICEPSIDRDRIRDRVEKAKRKLPTYLHDEIPGFDSLRNVMVATGAFDGWEFGTEYLSGIKKIKGHIGGHTICVDTNVLYNRFVSSTMYPHILEEGLPHPPEFVMSNMVEGEVRKKMNKRYDKKDIEKLVELGGPAYQGLDRQYRLKSRRAKLALSELNFIDNQLRMIYHGDEEFIDDNEERDIRIVKEYEDSYNETRKKPLIFGFEYSFKNKCSNVPFVFLRYPKDLFDVKIDHNRLSRLILYMAQVYGVIQLKGLGCQFLGVWKGMTDSDFEKGRVTALFDDGSGMVDELRDCVDISTAVKQSMK